ncbi:MAG TPA: hypothetical protein VIP05_28890, partial [Burkholderiaceae bacterium]
MPDQKKHFGHPLLTIAATLALAAAVVAYPRWRAAVEASQPIAERDVHVPAWVPLATARPADLDAAFVFDDLVASRIEDDATTLAVLRGTAPERSRVLQVASDGGLRAWHEVSAAVPCEHGWFVADFAGRWSGLAQDGTRTPVTATGAPREACRGDAAAFPQAASSVHAVSQVTSLRGEPLGALPAAASAARARPAGAVWP